MTRAVILTTGMAHQRKLIRQAVVALLASANTAAGARVLGTRVEPHKKSQLPAISVYTLSESTDPVSDETAPVELTRNLKLEVTGWVAHTDAIPVDDAMDNLAEQIEAAMAADYYIGGAVAITAVDHATGLITMPAHGLATGISPAVIAAGVGGVVPAGLSALNEYWAIVVDANTIKLAISASKAEGAVAVSFAGNGTLPLQLMIGTVAAQYLEATEMQVVEDDGRSDPLVGIVTLTYAVTYRTSPVSVGGNVQPFTAANVTHQLVGGVSDTVPAVDQFVESQ